MEPDDKRLVFLPIDKAIVPPPGLIEHLKDHWWVACPQRGLILFDADGKRRGGYSAQCNVIEAITRSFRERLFPWADVVQLPSVFRAVERGEFL